MIGWLAQDSRLTDLWRERIGERLGNRIRYFPDLETLLANGENEWSRVVVAERSIGHQGFTEWLNMPGFDPSRLIVILDGDGWMPERSALLRICAEKGITAYEPWSRTDPVNELKALLFGAESAARSKRIVFGGTTPNIGTTVIAIAFAAHLAARTGMNVGYLCMNLKSSKLHRYLGVKPGRTLDDLCSDMSAGTLDQAALTSAMTAPIHGLDNLRVLFGNQRREQAEYYTAEGCRALMSVAGESFDAVVVDVNAYWDNPATLSAMLESDWRLVVSTPEPTHVLEDWQSWISRLQNRYRTNIGVPDLILTQSDAVSGGCKAKDIRRYLGRSPVAITEYRSEVRRWLAEGTLGDRIAEKEFHPLSSALLRAGANRIGLPATDVGLEPESRRWHPLRFRRSKRSEAE